MSNFTLVVASGRLLMRRSPSASPALRTGLVVVAVVVACSAVACSPTASTTPPSTASPSATVAASDAAGDWRVLFDGTTVAGLRSYGEAALGAGTLPASWVVADGRLRTIAGTGVDLVTTDVFGDFELELTWAMTHGANSGVMYRVIESADPSWASGPEYQLLDDAGHPDGANPLTSAGALYGLIAPGPGKHLAPVGDDNESRIVVRDGHVEHWLNGEQVVAYDWRSDEMLALIAASKFRDSPAFMTADEGRVAFQHHGQEMSFGSIRIRSLAP
jgi:Domain of Unknown Function (DUF1080)